MITTHRLKIAGFMLGFMLLSLTSMAATKVEVNGNPVYFAVEPFQVMNRTMVPMRPIFEALGASVQWNDSTQTVTARKDETVIKLTIGETEAMVNGQSVALDIPAMVRRGSTMVPLRFVGEALGAEVGWAADTQTVTISTDGFSYNTLENNGTEYDDSGYNETGNNEQPNNMQTVYIPLGTVIPVTLDTSLNSLTSNVGDSFSTTVRSSQDGDAEFPRGTRLVGRVIDVQQAGDNQPGMIDLSFDEALLPNGSKATIYGSLISLDDESVTQTTDGRLQAKVKPNKDNRLKMIGIGAGAGLIIGKLLDQNLIVGGLLGAAAGYLYDEYTKEDVEPADVVANPGTVFGVRMDRNVSYNVSSAFISARNAYKNEH